MRRFLPLLALVACDPETDTGSADDTGGVSDTAIDDTDDSTDTDDTDDTDVEGDHGAGTLTGLVTVQLYTSDESGDTTEVAWADWSDTFPFGAIFVAAYTLDETTNTTTYHDQTVILSPLILGNTYELSVDLDAAESVYLYASLDYSADGVIGTADPIGVYPELVAVVESGSVSDLDIVINAETWSTGGGGGGDTGGGTTLITLSGTVAITDPYTGGDGKVMLYDSAGNGPEYVSGFTPTATTDGAEADWSLAVPPELGDKRLLGAWDSNINGLIEPTDLWGAYVVSGANANPLAIGGIDLPGLNVEIPFGIAPAITPFVRIEGTLEYADDFSTLPAGATVYVTAVRTRPAGDFSVADLERGYDWQLFTGADLVGTELDYILLAPSSEVAYLWAFGDMDGDGVLNEVGEPVASWGRTGRVDTGTSNQTGMDMELQLVVE
jgi:hypothetical protein